MEDERGDIDLLKAWASARDQDAVAQLVRRHINFVYATARRQVRDAHLAEDVTQAVFILLLQRGHRIKSEAAMTSWLFTTTRYAASNAVKSMHRREFHEQKAASMAPTTADSHVSQDQVEEALPLLDEGIERLARDDRACIVMSFLQGKTHRQVATALGVSEEAARKRVGRAVERLRRFFISRGQVAPACEAVALVAGRVAAPEALLQSTLNVAILSQSAAGTSSAAAIAKGVTKMLFTTKLKLAAAAGIAITCTGLVTGQVARHLVSAGGRVATASIAAQLPPTTRDASSIALGNGVSVRFAGWASWGAPDDEWFSIDGNPTKRPAGAPAALNGTISPPPSVQIVVDVVCPDDAEIRTKSIPESSSIGNMARPREGERIYLSALGLNPEVQTIGMEVAIADGPWQTIFTQRQLRKGFNITGTESGKTGDIAISEFLEAGPGQYALFVSTELADRPWRVVGMDTNGKELIPQGTNRVSGSRLSSGVFTFNRPPGELRSVLIQTRSYSRRVIARNISINPAKPSVPQISIDDGQK